MDVTTTQLTGVLLIEPDVFADQRGFLLEAFNAADYADAAVQTIYAGTNEIMKVIIARKLGLG